MAKITTPAIPVRQNRTVRLRRIFQVCNDDMSYLMNPPQSESSPAIVGQNKSVSKLADRQVSSWYKEQFYMMERMNKCQNDAYDSFLRIEREKTELTKVSNMLDDVDDDDDNDNRPKALPSRDGTINISNLLRGEGKYDKDENAEKVDENDKDENGEDSVDNGLVEVKDKPKSSKSVQILQLPDIDNNIDRTKFRHTAPSNTGSKSLDNFRAPEQRSKSGGSSLSRNAFFKSKGPDAGGKQVSFVSMSANPFAGMARQQSDVVQRQRRVLDQPVVPWTRTKSGRMQRWEGPYRRRAFPTPRDPVAEANKKNKLIEKERVNREMHVRKYTMLCDNITELSKWDPLEEIRARMPKPVIVKDKDENNNMGSMGIWSKAFKFQDDYIKSLDPNSQEALEMCKYLRKKGEPIPSELADIEVKLVDKNDNDEKTEEVKPVEKKKKRKTKVKKNSKAIVKDKAKTPNKDASGTVEGQSSEKKTVDKENDNPDKLPDIKNS